MFLFFFENLNKTEIHSESSSNEGNTKLFLRKEEERQNSHMQRQAESSPAGLASHAVSQPSTPLSLSPGGTGRAPNSCPTLHMVYGLEIS